MISWGPTCDQGPSTPTPAPESRRAVNLGEWLGGLPATPAACLRKAALAVAAGIAVALVGAWLPAEAGDARADAVVGRVLSVALLTTATSLILHGLSYAVGGIQLLRKERGLPAPRPGRG